MPPSANRPTLAHDLATETWDRTITQDKCPLFSQLSPEIRTTIFEFVVTAYDDKSNPYSETAYYYRPGYRYHQRISITLLLTCRRIYFETYLLPAKCNEVVEWFFRGPSGSSGALTKRLTVSPEQLAVTPCVHLFVQQYWLESQWINLASSHIRHLKPRILHLTLRRSDWWHWESGAKLCLDPKLQGRVPEWIVSEASDDFAEGSWGNAFRRLRGLREFKLELETTILKKDELDAIVERAPSWQFPLGDGNILILDESKTITAAWIGQRASGGLTHHCRGSLPVQSFNWHPQSVHSYPHLNSNIPRSMLNSSTSAAGRAPNSQISTIPLDTLRILRLSGIDPNHLSSSHFASLFAPSPHPQSASVQSTLRSLGLPRNDDTTQSTRSQGQQNRRTRASQIQQQIRGTATSLTNAQLSAQQIDMQGHMIPSFLPPFQFQQQVRVQDQHQMQLDNLARQQQRTQHMQHVQQPVVSMWRGPSSAQQQAAPSNPGLNSSRQSRLIPPTVHPQSTYHVGQNHLTPRPGPLIPPNTSQYAPPFSGGPLPYLATLDTGLHSAVEDRTQAYYVVTLRWFSRTAA